MHLHPPVFYKVQDEEDPVQGIYAGGMSDGFKRSPNGSGIRTFCKRKNGRTEPMVQRAAQEGLTDGVGAV